MKKLIFLFCLCGFLANAQLPNFNFEFGDLTNWTSKHAQRGFSGYSLTAIANCTTAVTPTFACGNSIVDSVNYKFYNGVSIIPPNNAGLYVLQQNSGQSNDYATIAEYSFVVSATTTSLAVRRLIFLNVSNETNGNDAYSEISIKDMSGNIIPGTQEIYSYNTYSASALTTTLSNIKYLPWTWYNAFLTPYMGQTVTVQLISSSCSASGHQQVSFFDGYFAATATGLNSLGKNEQLSIVPNPASEIISITNSENKDMQISVYDLQGREIIKGTNKNINISALDRGMYIIKAASESKMYSQTFIKE